MYKFKVCVLVLYRLYDLKKLIFDLQNKDILERDSLLKTKFALKLMIVLIEWI